MPFWPFRKRRRRSIKDEAKEPLTEKAQPAIAATYPPAGPTPPIPIPRKSSKRGSQRKRRASQEHTEPEAQWTRSEKPPGSSEKENVPPPISRRRSSREDITALPMSRKLESSPHLRPVDLQKPPIPYNFQQYSGSQTSVQRDHGVASPPRPNTLKKRSSGYDSAGTPSRRQSSRRRKDDHVREEEIRAMSAQIPIPKRPGGFSEGPLRRDSKKLRSVGMKESNVSLPPEESIHSTMSAIVEQRGWEIGSIDIFNPRPAVRLSGVPQYVTPGSLPTLPSSPLSQEPMKKEKEKMPATRDSAKKRETIGTRADEFDAGDIRMLLERDAKRKEKKKKEQQDKLDRKLRNRNGRNRGDSDKKRREAEEARRAEEARQRAHQDRVTTPLTAVHPALRDAPAEKNPAAVGLGIGERQAEPGASESEEKYHDAAEVSDQQPENPFTDDAMEQEPTPAPEQAPTPTPPRAISPMQTPMEDPVLETAREMRISQTATPPLSPVQSARGATSLSQMMETRRASDLPPPPVITDQRRASDPKHERRAGAWATFFRRGGTNLRKPGEVKSPSSEASFSNTSRESMRNQPLPPHLVDTQAGQLQRKSGTPVRTQSKFREDLPEMPISPPDSRLPSPDVTTAAAAAAASRRAGRSSAPVDIPRDTRMAEYDPQSGGRSDTPMTPSAPSQRITSMGSVDSEGSWFASGSAKRHSTQSGLTQRRGEFSASYEELGGDKDAEYVGKMATSPSKQALQSRTINSPTLAGDDPAEESEEDEPGESGQVESPGDPMTVHESMRRKPTLVHRDPRVKSREGLRAEYGGGEADTPIPTSAGTGRGSMLDFDPDEPEPEMQRAASVKYGQGHTRQISAGSVKLLDVPPRRPSTDVTAPTSPTSPTSGTMGMWQPASSQQ